MEHNNSYSVVIGDRGRLVLPAAVRERLGIQPGDRLILTVEPDGTLRAVGARELARRAQGMFKQIAPDRSLADELIEERREEARREEAVE